MKYFDDVAIGASRQHILNCPAYSPSKIYCFEKSQNIANYKISLLISQQINRTNDINHVIRRVFEAGLFWKWHADSERRKKFEPLKHIPMALTFEHFSAGFVFVLLIGWSLACLAFVSEHIIRLKIQERNGKGIWIRLEYFFDGKRHYFLNLPDKM